MTAITPVSKQLTLLKREFWEQRISFVLIPLACAMLAGVTAIVATWRAYIDEQLPAHMYSAPFRITSDSPAEHFSQFADAPLAFKEGYWNQYYSIPTAMMFIVFATVMLFYFLITLHQQRKDRSILFWNSMPVSNTQTILSKVIAGLVLAQLVYALCIFATQLIMLLVALVYTSTFDVDLMSTVIEPANLFSRFFTILGACVVNIFWCLPFYAWLLFNSAWAKTAPLAWAAAPILILMIPELIIYKDAKVLETVLTHAIPGFAFQAGFEDYSAEPGFFPELLISAVLGVGLLFAAIHFNRSEDL